VSTVDGLNVGDRAEIEITGLSHVGEGVGRRQGLVMFVPLVVPGERVRVEITAVGRTFARGRLVEVLERSRTRVEPGCALFGDCGGCHLLHIDYPEQLRWKTVQVRDALTRLGGLGEVPVANTLGMNEPRHYRNKAHFHVSRDSGRLALGFLARGSHRVTCFVDADGGSGCLLVQRDLLRVAARAAALLESLRVPLYDWETQRGYLRNLLLRRAAATGEIMLVLVTGRQNWPGEREFAERLTAEEPGVVSVIRNVNALETRELLGPENRVRAGEPAITEHLGGLKFRIGPASFFQVNPEQAEKTYEIARLFAGLTGKETVVDAYSGIGTIALFLASRAKSVIGFEALPAAVADAQENALRNGIKNVRFEQGAVEDLLPEWAARGRRVDVAVLDPPRRGCGPAALEALGRLRPRRVVYVSCAPATLARDLGRLAELGFDVVKVQPVDMFPQTHHIECVVSLKRKHSP